MARAIALLLALSLIALPSHAAKSVTVAELEQTLHEMRGKPDADVAWRIASLGLTERLTPRSLARLQSSLPGDKSKQALVGLADQAAFLDPPRAELPTKSAPDFAEQRRIMALAVNYVHDTIRHLPNFFATRATARYEDTPQVETLTGLVPYQPMHFVDQAKSTVLYRDGREVVELATSRGKSAQSITEGLTTWGVFGPILGSVLLDAAQSKLAWSNWEQGDAGLVAVFNFTVPRERSHYEINYCCVASQSATEVADLRPFKTLVGYHGAMSIDPMTGSILRIAVVADLKPTDPVVKAAIVVEYGSVEIAGTPYICPLRSISDTVAQSLQRDPRYAFALARQIQPLKTSVNEVSFENYHVFRSDAKVLSPVETALAQSASSAETSATPSPAEATPSPGEISAGAPAVDTSPSPQLPAGPAESAAVGTPEIAVAEANAFPDLPPTNTASTALGAFTLHTTTRLVDVAFIAYDKKGKPVADLQPEEVEIYDNGRKQEIKYFGRAGADQLRLPDATSSPAPAPPAEQEQFTNRFPTGTPSPNAANTTIVLLDAANVAFGDLGYAREEVLRFLKTVAPEERIGLYVMKSRSLQILLEPTTDHVAVGATLSHWMPTAQDLARAQDEEGRNRQQMEYVESASDLLLVNGNARTRERESLSAVDPQLRALGSDPSRDSLILLAGIARHLAEIAGHKSLVWVSSDNVLADWTDQAPSVEKTMRTIDPLAVRAQEALNEAHVSIYPLDASQLETGGISAALPQNNVQVNPAAEFRVKAQLASLPPSERDEALEALEKSQRDINPGQLTAQLHQDEHPIQGTFRALAEATGGRALRRAGDIAGELDRIVADGRAAYQLSFAPDTLADDQYHLLTVELIARRDVNVRSRTGYLYSREPATFKDRFRATIWQPRDATEVGVRVTPKTTDKGVVLNLAIAGTDLQMAEQDQRWIDQLGIFLALRNDTTLDSKVVGQSLRMRLQPGTYEKIMREGVPFELAVPAKVDFESLRIVVVDENSGRIGSVTLPARGIQHAP
jgi:VWFA-related protein